MAKRDTPVQNLRDQAADILNSGHKLATGQLVWCKRLSPLWGKFPGPGTHSVVLAHLVRAGILEKMRVSSDSKLAKRLPSTVFDKERLKKGHIAVAALYMVADRKRLRLITSTKSAALELLGLRYIPATEVPFEHALEVVRKTIAEHPDPGARFVEVINKLSPKRLNSG